MLRFIIVSLMVLNCSANRPYGRTRRLKVDPRGLSTEITEPDSAQTNNEEIPEPDYSEMATKEDQQPDGTPIDTKDIKMPHLVGVFKPFVQPDGTPIDTKDKKMHLSPDIVMQDQQPDGILIDAKGRDFLPYAPGLIAHPCYREQPDPLDYESLGMLPGILDYRCLIDMTVAAYKRVGGTSYRLDGDRPVGYGGEFSGVAQVFAGSGHSVSGLVPDDGRFFAGSGNSVSGLVPDEYKGDIMPTLGRDEYKGDIMPTLGRDEEDTFKDPAPEVLYAN